MDIENLLNNEVFKSLSKEKLEIIKNFMEDIKEKNIEESFSTLINYKEIFNKNNDMTIEQKNSIMNLIIENLPEDIRKKIKFILSMTSN